jgi:hypothetical protein
MPFVSKRIEDANVRFPPKAADRAIAGANLAAFPAFAGEEVAALPNDPPQIAAWYKAGIRLSVG